MKTLEAAKSAKRVSLKHVRKTLCEFRVEQTNWSLSCSLNPIDISLQVEIKDLMDRTTATFFEQGLVDVSHAQMSSD